MNKNLLQFTTPDILVVDDIPENLALLSAVLKTVGYKVRQASSGPLALDAARSVPPDLILLDVMMPEMTGYEVCAQLKAEPALADIPVIFLSALGEGEDKVKGLSAGGVDYITKPFHAAEVRARIAVHLELRLLRQELRRQNEILEERVRQRTRELAEARDRLAILDHAKSDFLALIEHELRTPLNGVLGIAELIFDATPDVDPGLMSHYASSRRRLISVLDDSLLLTQMGLQAAQLAQTAVPLASALAQAVSKVSGELDCVRRITFGPLPPLDAEVLADPELLEKALDALLEIAAKFSSPGSEVKFQATVLESEVVVELLSHGWQIPADFLPKIFDLLSMPETIVPGGDLGLKIPLAERIVALMGGSLAIENREPLGVGVTARFKRSAF